MNLYDNIVYGLRNIFPFYAAEHFTKKFVVSLALRERVQAEEYLDILSTTGSRRARAVWAVMESGGNRYLREEWLFRKYQSGEVKIAYDRPGFALRDISEREFAGIWLEHCTPKEAEKLLSLIKSQLISPVTDDGVNPIIPYPVVVNPLINACKNDPVIADMLIAHSLEHGSKAEICKYLEDILTEEKLPLDTEKYIHEKLGQLAETGQAEESGNEVWEAKLKSKLNNNHNQGRSA